MQLNDKKEPLLISRTKPKITLKNDYLVKMQMRHLWLTNVIPLLGFLILMGLIGKYGINGLDIVLFVGMYAISLIGITVGFHRHFSHGAFETNKIIKVILVILGSMAAQSPLVYWVAQHRRHHAYSDLNGDPHSPHIHEEKQLGRLEGLWHGHIGWVLVPEATNTARFARDLIQDSLIYKVSQLYFIWVIMGLLIPTLLGGVLTASWLGAFWGFLWGGLARIFVAQQVTFSVNSICHVYGNRPFDTREKSTNNLWLAIPTLGEAWHNNHHAFINSAKFGLKGWQIDVGYWVIHLLELLSLAWDVKVPNSSTIEGKKAFNP